MKVILKERVDTLGMVGDLVDVSTGYARNYLIPNHLAIFADEKNQSFVVDQKVRLQKKIEEQKKDAQFLSKKIDNKLLEFTRKVSANGKLFGTISASDVAQKLVEEGFAHVQKRMVLIKDPIKKLGEYSIKVKLLNDVTVEVRVLVKKLEEGETSEVAKAS